VAEAGARSSGRPIYRRPQKRGAVMADTGEVCRGGDNGVHRRG
jgi:hypothetical protein